MLFNGYQVSDLQKEKSPGDLFHSSVIQVWAHPPKAKVLLSHVQVLAAPWTLACQAPVSMEFSRQEYWSGLPFPSPGDLPTQGSCPGLLHCSQVLYCLSHQQSPTMWLILLNKLKLQYFDHLMRRADSFEKTLMPWCWERLRAEGKGDDWGWDEWMTSRTQWIWVWGDFRNWWWTGWPGMLRFVGSQRVRHNWVTELNSAEYYNST